SLRAQDLLTAQLPKNGATGSSFDIVFAGGSLKVTDSAFQAAVDESLLPLRADARVTSVTTPWSVTPDLAGQLESRDGSEALTVVTVKDGYLVARIDYSLFIVNRFREELVARRSVPLAIERSMATAGRAVMFSGLTVAVGLAGMLFYPGTFLVSMGLAGSIVVALAVIFALTFLPAL